MRPLTPDEAATVEANMGLVRHVVYRKMGLHGDRADEAIAAGAFGLMRAVQKFDPSRGFKLSTYADAWIRQAIRIDRRCFEGVTYRAWQDGRGQEWRSALSIDSELDTADGPGLSALDRTPAPDDTEAEALARHDAHEVASFCSDDLDRAIVAAAARGDHVGNAGRCYGVSRQAALMRLRRLRRRAQHLAA